jgi:hypothetical protein
VEKNYAINYVKFFGIFLVVWYHAAPYDLQLNGGLNALYFLYLIPLFPKFVVSYFFVISGFLYGKKVLSFESLNEKKLYKKKYVIRLIKLFISWYSFYFIYDSIKCIFLSNIHGLNVGHQLIKFVISQIKLIPIYYGYGNTSFQLWYLTALIYSIIILQIFIKFKKEKLLLWVALFFNLIGLFGQRYSGIFYLPIHTNDCLFYGLFYTTLGYFFATRHILILKKVEKLKTTFLIKLFIAVFFFGFLENTIALGPLNGYKGGNSYSLSTIPLTIILLLIVLKNPNWGKNSILAKIGGGADGVYLTHVLLLSLMTNFLIIHNIYYLQSRMLFNLLITPVIFVLSYYFYIIFQLCNKILRELWSRTRLLTDKKIEPQGDL